MIIKSNKITNLIFKRCLQNRHLNQKLNYSNADYLKLKPVDLSFIKFDSNDSSRTPVFIYHGLFGNYYQ